MKATIATLYTVLFTIGIFVSQPATLFAKDKYDKIVEQVDPKVVDKVNEISKKMTNDLDLSTKQVKKVKTIKLLEAQAIEKARADKSLSALKIKDAILLIKNNAEQKVGKVLKKDQEVLWNSKKSTYEYSPGFFQNLKDKFNETLEKILD